MGKKKPKLIQMPLLLEVRWVREKGLTGLVEVVHVGDIRD